MTKVACYCGEGCENGVDPRGDASSRQPRDGNIYSNWDADLSDVDRGATFYFGLPKDDGSQDSYRFADRAEFLRWERMSMADKEAYVGFVWLHPDDRKALHLPPAEVDARTGKPKPEDPEKRAQRLEAMSYLKAYEGSFDFLLDLKDRITPPRRGRLSDAQVAAVLKCKARDDAKATDMGAWVESTPRAREALDWLNANWERNDFARSLRQAFARYGHLTERQLAAVLKSVDRDGPARPEAAERPPAVEGIYKVGDDIYKVQKAVHGSGRLYAKHLVEAEGKGTWEYAPGKVNTLSADDLMPLEEAAAFGRLYGWCIVCGRTLTDETSIAAGIGPVCRGRFA